MYTDRKQYIGRERKREGYESLLDFNKAAKASTAALRREEGEGKGEKNHFLP